jgi:hypothetical protein
MNNSRFRMAATAVCSFNAEKNATKKGANATGMAASLVEVYSSSSLGSGFTLAPGMT